MFKKLTDDAKLPCRNTPYSASFDVFTNENVTIGPGETKLIRLGIAIDLDLKSPTKETLFIDSMKGAFYLELHIADELVEKGLISLPKIINIDYLDEIKMVVHNLVKTKNKIDGYGNMWSSKEINTNVWYGIDKGDKIGQLILKRHEGYLLQEYTTQN